MINPVFNNITDDNAKEKKKKSQNFERGRYFCSLIFSWVLMTRTQQFGN